MPGRKPLLVMPLLLCASALAADYKGPLPPKQDIPYLLHASNLVPTEVTQASQENQKKSSTYTIPGATSTAKTPLAEPIFILDSRDLDPASLELWRLDSHNGQRAVSIVGGTHHRGSSGPFHLSVTKVGDHLYRIESQEMLENGEYSLSPAGSNRAYCFEIY
jgi:hypothetical protein